MHHVYILTSKENTVLYIGVTNNLNRRLWEHKNHVNASFTKRYNVSKLVYFESFDEICKAIDREKQLKGWRRDWKNELIETINPDWKDLSDQFPE